MVSPGWWDVSPALWRRLVNSCSLVGNFTVFSPDEMFGYCFFMPSPDFCACISLLKSRSASYLPLSSYLLMHEGLLSFSIVFLRMTLCRLRVLAWNCQSYISSFTCRYWSYSSLQLSLWVAIQPCSLTASSRTHLHCDSRSLIFSSFFKFQQYSDDFFLN